MSVNIEVVGVKQLRDYMNKISMKTTLSVTKGVATAALHTQNKVKSSIAGREAEKTSVDTGRFLNSVGVRKIGKNNAEVFSDLSYAKFIEFETSRFAARRHFGNTEKRERPKIKEILNRDIIQGIKKVRRPISRVLKSF